ncbi:MAG: esterase [Planctomycetes bacterium]|nr:esterase [Planctomycetota bacterium]
MHLKIHLYIIAFSLLTLTGAIHINAANEHGPIGDIYYPRGGFNGWSAETPFTQIKAGLYEVNLKMAPGYHELKIANKGWRNLWCVKAMDDKALDFGKKYPLIKGKHGSRLWVKQTSSIKMLIDFRQEEPVLLIEQSALLSRSDSNPHQGAEEQSRLNYKTYDEKNESVTFSVEKTNSKYRSYSQSTTQILRDPVPQFSKYSEKPGFPRLRSGSLSFDALFALAQEECRLNSVEEIKDGNYNEGKPLAHSVFETGEKWHYVWTRDLSYAADLGLCFTDPHRVVNSLIFKTGRLRPEVAHKTSLNLVENGLQIVQDTGTGGSWPISTDRVSWAFGATKVLAYIKGEKRQAFARHAYDSLKNTLVIDRKAAFDQEDGLYSGEQSFLDWREQSYSKWILDDLASLGSAKSLSTNACHYQALALAAKLANEFGDHSSHKQFAEWANELKLAINEKLWLEDAGLYSSITAGHHDSAALHKFDWLGQSLVIITGIAGPERAQKIMQNYPHGPLGAPVIFPQQPDVSVYHNRAIWPFVTTYGLKAAARSKCSDVADRAYETLIRGAALNLSNMENLEWLSAQPLLLDTANPKLIGPEINSKRQLWSVGGYIGMVMDTLFGLKVKDAGLKCEPFITSRLRRSYLKESNKISLLNVNLRGKKIDITIHLAEINNDQGYYPVVSTSLNHRKVNSGIITWDSLLENNTIEVTLGSLKRDSLKAKVLSGDPYSKDAAHLFAPRVPEVESMERINNKIRLKIGKQERGGLSYKVYVNGKVVDSTLQTRASDVNGTVISLANRQKGYLSVVAFDERKQVYSHHSKPISLSLAKTIYVDDARVTAKPGLKLSNGPTPYLSNWGKTDERLLIKDIHISESGKYSFQCLYRNLQHRINLGITNGVKKAMLLNSKGDVVCERIIQMPHTKKEASHKWHLSTPLITDLKAGKYKLVLEDYINMSYLDTNESYGSSGGIDGAVNCIDLRGYSISHIKN